MIMNYSFPSLHHYFRHAATQIKKLDDVYLLEKKDGEETFSTISYREVMDATNAVTAYLHNMGLEKQAKIALIIENCPQYIMFDQGLMQIGLVNVSIYPTLSESEITHILNDSGAEAILVGTPFLLKKIMKIKGECPSLREIIISFKSASKPEGVTTWEEMIEKGNALYPSLKDAIEKRL